MNETTCLLLEALIISPKFMQYECNYMRGKKGVKNDDDNYLLRMIDNDMFIL